jgi:hypothetical protein
MTSYLAEFIARDHIDSLVAGATARRSGEPRRGRRSRRRVAAPHTIARPATAGCANR